MSNLAGGESLMRGDNAVLLMQKIIALAELYNDLERRIKRLEEGAKQ